MFQCGDYIIYGSTGVCLIEEILVPDYVREHSGCEKLYYKLCPVFNSETIYIPVDTDLFMRPIISRKQAEALLDRIPEIDAASFDGKDRREIAASYQNFIKKHECEDLIRLIKAIYKKNLELTQHGKKPGQTDLQYMKQAETLLHGELSVALGISPDEVPDYIARRAEEKTNKR